MAKVRLSLSLWLALVGVVFVCAAGSDGGGKGKSAAVSLRPEFQGYALEDAEREVQELMRMVSEQERLVEGLKGDLWQPTVGTCGAHGGQECAREDEAEELASVGKRGGKKRRKKEVKPPANPAEFFRAVAKFRIPKGAKATSVRWLPYPNTNSNKKMNRLLVASDAKGSLHFFDESGTLLSSHPTGSSTVTSMSVCPRWDGEMKVFTAGSAGEARSFSVSPPPRHRLPQEAAQRHSAMLDEQRAKAGFRGGGPKIQPDASSTWAPMVSQTANFIPSTMEMLPWDNRTKLTADMSAGPKPLKFVEWVARGKASYNTIVGDSAGRVSVHIKNGTILASFQVWPQPLPPSLLLSLSRSLPPPSLSPCLSPCLPVPSSICPCLYLSIPLSVPLKFTHTLSILLSLCHCFSNSHTLSLSFSLSVTVFHASPRLVPPSIPPPSNPQPFASLPSPKGALQPPTTLTSHAQLRPLLYLICPTSGPRL